MKGEMTDLTGRTWAEVNLKNIAANMEAIRKTIPENTKFLGVVKADAYGHGAVKVAETLEKAGADYLAVACLAEAVELREGGISLPVLILGHTPAEYTDQLLENGISQTVTSLAAAKAYSEEAEKSGKKLTVHINVDTGMSRLGFQVGGPEGDAGVREIAEACSLPGLAPEGIYTHFAVSDEDGEENEAYTEKQFALFTKAITKLEEYGVHFALRHCANTGATVKRPEYCLDMVRPGLLLYGYGDPSGKIGVRPCMSLFTRIVAVKTCEPGTSVSYGRHFITDRKTRIGVLALGYADGLHRCLSGKAEFVCLGKKICERGNICMDMCMADLSELPEAEVGTEVEIFGEENSLDALSALAGTIPYELLCAVSKRVPRIYV